MQAATPSLWKAHYANPKQDRSSSPQRVAHLRLQLQPAAQLLLPTVAALCHVPPTDNVSWVVNILLLVAKGYAWWISGSKAVLASLVDSLVDLVRQALL